MGNPTLDEIRLDGGTQVRAQIDLFTVEDYADAMLAGANFPAIIAYYDGTDYWLADGFHRIEAAKRANVDIAVDVRAGTVRDAKLHAVGANASHGLRRTNEDKRRAVLMLLNDDEWRRWSDSEIARKCFVSHMTVQRHRNSLEQSASEPTERVYVDRYGNERVMNTANIGGATPANQPSAPVVPIEYAEELEDNSFDDWHQPTQTERQPSATDNPHLAVLLNNDVEWYTPPEYIEAAKDILGEIDLDPASNPTAQQIIGAKQHYTKDTDGLAHEWRGKVWMNPPWGRICADFVSKLVDHYNAGEVAEAILLLNSNSNETEWFQPLWDHTLCFSRGRINYYTADGERGAGSTHGSVFVYMGPNSQQFAKRFAEFGNVVRRVSYDD
jgi:hypothetical protein